MTKIKSISEIGNLYESIYANSNIITEKKDAKKFPKGTFLPSHEDAQEPKTFKDSGPKASVKGSTSTPKKKKNKKNARKTVRENINSFMKSKFDRLFENVMDDDSDFNMSSGPNSGPEGEAGEMGSDLDLDTEVDSEDTGGEDVTLTLDKETAQKLIDVLQAAIGGDEGFGEDESDLEELEIEDEGEDSEDNFDLGSDEDEDEEEMEYNETTGSEKLPDSAGQKLTKGYDVPGHVKATKGKASSEVTDETGSSTLGDKTGHQLTKPGNNKVGNLKTGKSLF